jgi:putative SOS response-associated peptidase YedK
VIRGGSAVRGRAGILALKAKRAAEDRSTATAPLPARGWADMLGLTGYDAPVCSNYRPVTRKDRLLTFFGVERGRDEEPIDVWPLGIAPFIRLAELGSRNRLVVDDGLFGLLPHFQAEPAPGRKTYNARTETVATKPSFQEAWSKGWRCIIPVEHIYEPYYASADAKPERWKIQQPMAHPFGIAGIYRKWRAPDGRELFTFAMLTVNADDHTFYRQFHKPGDEKRMPVILDREDYGPWLTCSVEEAPRFFRQWMGPLEAFAAHCRRVDLAQTALVPYSQDHPKPAACSSR